jgi:two-component system, NarL family, nitrate/nitrite response regulator NarL
MQAKKTNENFAVSKRNRRGLQSNLLLVGSEDGFKGVITHPLFFGRQIRVAGQSTTLLEGLFRLESEAIDLVLLSCEFHEEELSLFAFDAHRRGFSGLILHVASLPSIGGLSDGRFVQHGWEVESQEKSDGNFGKRRRIHTERLALNVQTDLRVDRPPGAISFTVKEQAVLARVSEGWSNHQIACHLNCSEGSIKAALQQIFRKLGVRKRSQIVRMAFEKTLIQP